MDTIVAASDAIAQIGMRMRAGRRAAASRSTPASQVNARPEPCQYEHRRLRKPHGNEPGDRGDYAPLPDGRFAPTQTEVRSAS